MAQHTCSINEMHLPQWKGGDKTCPLRHVGSQLVIKQRHEVMTCPAIQVLLPVYAFVYVMCITYHDRIHPCLLLALHLFRQYHGTHGIIFLPGSI